jgi:hypothetical protein
LFTYKEVGNRSTCYGVPDVNLKVNCEYTVQEEIWPFVILLIVNNASGHPTVIQELDGHIKVVFIPPNFNISRTTDG